MPFPGDSLRNYALQSYCKITLTTANIMIGVMYLNSSSRKTFCRPYYSIVVFRSASGSSLQVLLAQCVYNTGIATKWGKIALK